MKKSKVVKSLLMMMVILCLTIMAPVKESMAACSHPGVYVKYSQHISTETDSHTINGQSCTVTEKTYISYFYCSYCNAYLYYDLTFTYNHTNPLCK